MSRLVLNIALALAMTAGAAVQAREPGVSEHRIVFGQTIGFESIWGDLYKNYTEGLEAYFNDVNSRGGVHGRKLEVRRVEDRYETARAVRNVKEFGESGDVFGLVCIGGTGITMAVMPLLEHYKLPTVGTLTGFEGVRKYNRYLFHTRTGYVAEVEKMVQHLTTLGLTRIAVVYQDNAFGIGNLGAAQRAAAQYGARVVNALPHAPQGDDIARVLPRLAATPAQAVLMFTSPKSVADIITGYRARYGALPQPWILSVTSSNLVYDALKGSAGGIAVSQVMPYPSSTASQLATEFRAVMAKYGNPKNLTYEAVEGFFTAKVVVEGLRRAGRNLTREAYVNALEGLGTVAFDDFYARYTPTDHGGPSFVEITLIRPDGSLAR